MIDLLPYIRGNGRQYSLEYNIDGRRGTQTLQSQRGGKFFYQVKDREWERLYHDDHYIYREADISEAPDKYYILYQGGKRGSVWCPRHMKVGDQFLRQPLVVHYYKNDCRERVRGHYASTVRLLHHYPTFTFASNIVLQDVISMGWLVDGEVKERYLYARDFGLVGWIGAGRGSSYICEIHSGRPDLVRDDIHCLPDPDEVYYAPAPPPERRALGIDVSKWQGMHIDWGRVSRDSIEFAIIRASVGQVKDYCYDRNYSEAKAAGLLVGAYHYLHANEPVAQARHFVESRSLGDLPDVLDVEGEGKTASGVKAFLDEYRRLTGQDCMIYTGAYIWDAMPGDKSWASDYPLWVANYTAAPSPYMPRGWDKWDFWQYTSSGSVNGIAGRVDMNWFKGSSQDLFEYALEQDVEPKVIRVRVPERVEVKVERRQPC